MSSDGTRPTPSALIPPRVWALGFPKLSDGIVAVADAREGDFFSARQNSQPGNNGGRTVFVFSFTLESVLFLTGY